MNKQITNREIKVELGDQGYPVYTGFRIIDYLPEKLKSLPANKQIAIISAPPVADLYLARIKKILGADWHVISHNVPDGEISKSSDQVNKIYTWLLEKHFERKSTIIALGGGVVGDLTGFIAATYLRGVNLIQIPTTLLAQVDSSIGGKAGINHPLGKNLIGAFYQPKFVLADVDFLRTLPAEEYLCGMGEVVKYGILGNPVLFNLLESKLDLILQKDQNLLAQLVFDCARIKAKIVSEDEREQGVRAHLNLGHTFGHALETYFRPQGLKHGQAVLLGMRCAIQAARKLNLLPVDRAARMDRLIKKFDVPIPSQDALDTGALLTIMKRDKKVQDGRINLVLPEDIGRVVVKPVNDDDLLKDCFEILQPAQS